MRGIRKTRVWIETGIEGEIAVGRIEIRLVEDIERVSLEFQGIALSDFKILENRKIESRLEWSAEDISAIRPVAGFLSVADSRSSRCKAAWRHSTLARTKEWDREVIWINVWNSHSRERSRLKRIIRSPFRGLFGSDSRREWQNRIGDEVIGAEENTAGGSREIDDAEWFSALSHGDALNSPSICYSANQFGTLPKSGKQVNIADRKHVGTIKV